MSIQFFQFLQAIYISLGKRIYINKLVFNGLNNLNILKILDTVLSSPPLLTGIQQHLATMEFRRNKLASIPSKKFLMRKTDNPKAQT